MTHVLLVPRIIDRNVLISRVLQALSDDLERLVVVPLSILGRDVGVRKALSNSGDLIIGGLPSTRPSVLGRELSIGRGPVESEFRKKRRDESERWHE